VDIPSWYDLNKKISFLTQHGLTKWSGSASQHLIAPVIFFLNTTMQWEINYIMKLQIYHEVSKGAFQHPPSTDQTQSTGSCFFEKRLVFHFKTFIMSSFEYHPMARSDSCASVLVTVFFFRLMKRSYRAEISGAAGWNWQWQGATTERDTWQKNGPYWSCSFPIHVP